MAIKVVLVDDHPVLRTGIRTILETDTNIEIIGEAGDGVEAIELAKTLVPDIMVMDITMPNLNGIEATKVITAFNPSIKILALSIHTDRRFVKNMISSGAVGYLLKASAPEELLSAVHKIFQGEMYLSSSITKAALSRGNGEPEDEKSPPILNTKLQRPQITRDYLIRTSIITHLEDNVAKQMTLVSAPKGYGKSITISQWLAQTKRNYCWISLDEEHNELRIFLLYLHAAIENIYPDTLPDTKQIIVAKDLPSTKLISNTVINELDSIKENFIITIDNYHVIRSRQIHDFINELLKFPPQRLHFVLITQYDPPLMLASLRLHSQMNEIRMKELCFSEPEISELYKNMLNIDLDKEIIKTIFTQTEGWIVGLRLASLKLIDHNKATFSVQNTDLDFKLVSEAMISELLSEQSQAVQNKLLIISLFDKFNAELIDELFFKNKIDNKDELTTSGYGFLKWLIQANLFIVRLDSQNKWYRYHHFFKKILTKQIKHNIPLEEIHSYSMKACAWFESQGLIQEAFNCAIFVNDSEKLVKIIEEHRMLLINQNNWPVLEEMLSKLSFSTIVKRKELLLIQAYIHFYRFEISSLKEVIDQIDELNDKTNDNEFDEAQWFRNFCNYSEHDGMDGLIYLKQTINKFPNDKIELLGLTQLMHAVGCQMDGGLDAAQSQLFDALSNSFETFPLYENRLILGLLIIHYIAGNAKEVEQYLKAGRDAAKANKFNGAFACFEYFAGLFHLQRCEFELAISHLKKSVELRFVFCRRAAVDAVVGLALAYQALGQTKNAYDTLQVVNEFTDSLGPQYVVYAKCCKVRLELMNGQDKKMPHLKESYISFSPKAILFWFEVPLVSLCRILIAIGSPASLKKAEKHLQKLLKLIEKQNNVCQLSNILALLALLYKKQNETEKALDALVKSLKLAESQKYYFSFVELGQPIANLIKQLPEESIDQDLINLIINKKDVSATEFSNAKTRKIAGFQNIPFSLTARELEVLKHLSKGLRNKEIGAKMYVSDNTIKKHIYNMSQKLGVSNRTSLVSKANELGLLMQ